MQKVFLLFLMWLTTALMGCATNTIAQQTLSPATDQASIRLLTVSKAISVEGEKGYTYFSIPKGQYIPILRNAEGVFYICPSGIVLGGYNRLSRTHNPSAIRLVGGIYVPIQASEAPRFWFIAAGLGAATGRLTINDNLAERLREDCEPSQVGGLLTAYGTSPVVNVQVLQTEKSSKGVTPNIPASVISSFVVNSLIGAGDGQIVFPKVRLDPGLSPIPDVPITK